MDSPAPAAPSIDARLVDSLVSSIFGDISLSDEDSIRSLDMAQLGLPVHMSRLRALIIQRGREIVDRVAVHELSAESKALLVRLTTLLREEASEESDLSQIILAILALQSTSLEDYI